MRKIRIVFISAVTVSLVLGIILIAAFIRGRRPSVIDVRVLLASDVNEVSVSTRGAFVVSDTGSGRVLRRGRKPLVDIKALALNGKIRFDNVVFGDGIKITPAGREGIALDGTYYRGSITIRNEKSLLECVNHVGIEEYLRGVLPGEVYPYWPSSVLKAQAIASRSFAAYRAEERRGNRYDLRKDATSQVYGGMDREERKTTRAVHDTNGKVLAHKGRVFPAYFSPCSGGYRQSSEVLWGSPLGPLEGGRCIWCSFSPVFSWEEIIGEDIIVKKLKERGHEINSIDSMIPVDHDASGRSRHVRIVSGNRETILRTEEFRIIIGQNILKSSKFKVTAEEDSFVFRGQGWGHGVGMCQWGAFGMGVFLRGTGNILRTYYPGTEIADLRSLLDDQRMTLKGRE